MAITTAELSAPLWCALCGVPSTVAGSPVLPTNLEQRAASRPLAQVAVLWRWTGAAGGDQSKWMASPISVFL